MTMSSPYVTLNMWALSMYQINVSQETTNFNMCIQAAIAHLIFELQTV